MSNDSVSEPFPYLETERLWLRQTTLEDGPDIFAVFADPKVTEFHNLETFQTLGEALKVIERRIEIFSDGHGIRWGIELKATQHIVGSCGFSWHPDPAIKGAEMGYELASGLWRQGIMSEALSAILRYGFETKELSFVIAQVMLDNVASKKLLETLGFESQKIIQPGGFWKGQHHDLEQFVLEKSDFVFSAARRTNQ
ncbi:MAG: GNAT family N-acetyltransferase [Cyanobacteria bacterium P01_H01_bin.162]